MDSGGIGAGEPILYIVDGKLVEGNALQAMDPDRIASIEVRRKTDADPFNEIHITTRPVRQ